MDQLHGIVATIEEYILMPEAYRMSPPTPQRQTKMLALEYHQISSTTHSLVYVGERGKEDLSLIGIIKVVPERFLVVRFLIS
jgi:hypothetical protein